MASPEAVKVDRRPLTTQPSAVGPGGLGQGSEETPAAPQRGATPPIFASWVYSTYTCGSSGKSGASASPSSPLSQKLWTFVLRSAKVVGVGSESPSNTLIRPLFSATKTRPSSENSTFVGLERPPSTTSSRNPVESVGAASTDAESSETVARRTANDNVAHTQSIRDLPEIILARIIH